MDKTTNPTNRFNTNTDDDDDLLPLTEAKRQASLVFEQRYLIRVMDRAKGSVSEGARLSGLDRTNFRRLLHRHGIDPVALKQAAQAEQAAPRPTFDGATIRLVRQVGAAS